MRNDELTLQEVYYFQSVVYNDTTNKYEIIIVLRGASDHLEKASNSSGSYQRMARYYDLIYHHIVDYEFQTDFLERIIEKHSKKEVRSILDIACGTGNYSFILAKRGYKVTGIDLSKEMIEIALGKSARRTNPEFLTMDMRRINLPKRYDAAVVLFGGFGYLLNYSDVRDFLASTKRHLGSKNLLIFEFWQNSAIAPQASLPTGYRTWDTFEKDSQLLVRLGANKYDAQSGILTLNFDFYVLDTKSKDVSDTFSETHAIRTYSISEMRHFLEENNYKPIAFYDGGLDGKKKTLQPASQSTFRVLAVCSTS